MPALSIGEIRHAPLDSTVRLGVSSAQSATHDDVPRGILAMAGATLCLALSSAFAKYQVAHHPVGEVMFMRSISSLTICAMIMLPITGAKVFRTERATAHIARGLSQSVSQTFTVLALWLMPIAGATAISFSAPIWSALISILWLRERPGLARCGFLIIGFLGILIVAHPGADSLQVGAIFALANAIMYGSVTVAVRGMTKTESANTLLIWQLVTVAFFHLFLLPFGVDALSVLDIIMLVCSGIANAAGQWLWTRALRLGPTTAVSPFYYLTLVWALAIGFFAWGDVPSVGLIVGSCVVVGSGIVLVWHEARVRQSTSQASTVFSSAPIRMYNDQDECDTRIYMKKRRVGSR